MSENMNQWTLLQQVLTLLLGKWPKCLSEKQIVRDAWWRTSNMAAVRRFTISPSCSLQAHACTNSFKMEFFRRNNKAVLDRSSTKGPVRAPTRERKGRKVNFVCWAQTWRNNIHHNVAILMLAIETMATNDWSGVIWGASTGERQRGVCVNAFGDQRQSACAHPPRLWCWDMRNIWAVSLQSYMHTACILCVFWAHASDFLTSRPFLRRLVRSAFE